MDSRFFTSIRYHYDLDEYTFLESDYYDSTNEDEQIDLQQVKISSSTVPSSARSTSDKFYASEEESDYEPITESADHDTSNEPAPMDDTQKRIQLRNEFLAKYMDVSSEEEDDSGKRVVRSQKDKRTHTLSQLSEEARNSFDGQNWVQVQGSLEKLSKLVMKQTIKDEIEEMLDLLEELELRCKEYTQQEIKKMSPSQAKAFNSAKQFVRKLLKTYMDSFSYLFTQEESAEAATGEEMIKAAEVKAKSSAPNEIEEIIKKVNQILMSRGKKGVDSSALLASLKELLPGSPDFIKVRIYVAMLATMLDYNQTFYAYLPVGIWKEAFDYLKDLFRILQASISTIRIKENVDEFVSGNAKDGITFVKGNLTTLIIKVDEELFKSLLFLDPFSQEYADRLADEQEYVQLMRNSIAYFNEIASSDIAESISFRLMDHLYYKKENLAMLIEVYNSITKPGRFIQYKKNLFMLYSYSINEHFEEAEKLLKIVRNDDVHDFDASVQVLFHRCLVQYGLLCFHKGRFQECFDCLGEIFSSNLKPRELIGQSYRQHNALFLSVYAEKNIDERQERLRQLPYHMHINLESIEAVFFLVSFLFEIDNIQDGKKKTQGRGLKKAYEAMEKSMFSVPYLSQKDTIVSAVSHFLRCSWVELEKILCTIKIWTNFPSQSKQVYFYSLKVQFARYFIQHFVAPHYVSFSLNALIEQLALPSDSVPTFLVAVFGEEFAALINRESLLMTSGHLDAFRKNLNVPKDVFTLLREKGSEIVSIMHNDSI